MKQKHSVQKFSKKIKKAGKSLSKDDLEKTSGRGINITTKIAQANSAAMALGKGSTAVNSSTINVDQKN